MTSFVTLFTVSAATPDGVALFRDLTLSIGRERVGLVGRNGSGKSTLLRIAAGEQLPRAGSVTRSGSTGTLAQHWPDAISVGEALGVAGHLSRTERILAGDGSPEDFDSVDWEMATRIEEALRGVGLAGISTDRRMGSLSGGERTRIGIARLELARPDMLLLDEPTNNLDAAGRAAIQAMILGWRGGVLVASHDRALLEAMDRIVELTPLGVRIVGGGWSAFAAQREAERAQAVSEHERSEAALRATTRTLQAQREAKERRDKAGRAFAAKGSEPRILLGAQAERAENSGGQSRHIAARKLDEATDRLREARGKVEVITPLTITLPPSQMAFDAEVLALRDVTVRVGERRLGPWTLSIRGPERVSLAGPNGAGKTTLIEAAAGRLSPESGTVKRVADRIVALDQHVALLDPAATILENLRRLHPALNEEAVRATCARFAFRNRDAERMVGTLSGGERLRAGLAATLSGEIPPWLLILDEPTNHLDIASLEVLEQALLGFDGALLLVSHDQPFLAAIGVQREYRLDFG